jgi:hypothetical protein
LFDETGIELPKIWLITIFQVLKVQIPENKMGKHPPILCPTGVKTRQLIV